jgi:hypothetical protein
VATFIAVTTAWVFFRAENLASAQSLLGSMYGFTGHSLMVNEGLWNKVRNAPALIAVYLAVVWLLPNTQQLMGRSRPALDFRYRPDGVSWEGRMARQLQWRPTSVAAVWYATMLVASLCSFSKASEFIYFNF